MQGILCSGVFLLAAWLLDTSLGRDALKHSPVRRNSMPPFIPMVMLLIWWVPPAILSVLSASFTKEVEPWLSILWDNVIMSLGSLTTIVVVLIYAHFSFARGLKGLGLRRRGIGRDFGMAAVTLLATWPLVVTMVLVMTWVMQLWSPERQMQAHQGLEQLAQYPQVSLRVTIIMMAVILAPVVEELIFRGIFQSLLRGYTQRPWLSIVVASVFFASVHTDPTHWPALCMLSMAMGYSYEKSGSLWRPIFVHVLFNGITIASNLLAAG